MNKDLQSKDSFEEFVRSKMDQYKPTAPPHILENVIAKTQESSNQNKFFAHRTNWLKLAALFIFIAGSGILLWKRLASMDSTGEPNSAQSEYKSEKENSPLQEDKYSENSLDEEENTKSCSINSKDNLLEGNTNQYTDQNQEHSTATVQKSHSNSDGNKSDRLTESKGFQSSSQIKNQSNSNSKKDFLERSNHEVRDQIIAPKSAQKLVLNNNRASNNSRIGKEEEDNSIGSNKEFSYSNSSTSIGSNEDRVGQPTNFESGKNSVESDKEALSSNEIATIPSIYPSLLEIQVPLLPEGFQAVTIQKIDRVKANSRRNWELGLMVVDFKGKIMSNELNPMSGPGGRPKIIPNQGLESNTVGARLFVKKIFKNNFLVQTGIEVQKNTNDHSHRLRIKPTDFRRVGQDSNYYYTYKLNTNEGTAEINLRASESQFNQWDKTKDLDYTLKSSVQFSTLLLPLNMGYRFKFKKIYWDVLTGISIFKNSSQNRFDIDKVDDRGELGQFRTNDIKYDLDRSGFGFNFSLQTGLSIPVYKRWNLGLDAFYQLPNTREREGTKFSKELFGAGVNISYSL
ncbi:MAG TPA: hypothetical protein PK006_01595 [Saprospiraceae bacterium]|nr:hypothetical protein [Saprospiraceae bacterium]